MIALRIQDAFPRRLRRIYRIAGGPRKQSHHRQPMPHGPRFKPGDPVAESGIYEVIHGNAHRASHDVVLLKDDPFPECDSCGEEVRFRLIRTAPYIFQDGDFEEPI